MKYKVGDKVFHRDDWHQNCKGYEVLEAKKNFGGYGTPHYKVTSKETESGFVWLREWMLK